MSEDIEKECNLGFKHKSTTMIVEEVYTIAEIDDAEVDIEIRVRGEHDPIFIADEKIKTQYPGWDIVMITKPDIKSTRRED